MWLQNCVAQFMAQGVMGVHADRTGMLPNTCACDAAWCDEPSIFDEPP